MLTFVIIYVAIAALVGIDQWIKIWAIAELKGQPSRSFLPIGDFDWMHLTYVENDGAAFSMLSGSRAFLIVFPAIVIVLLLVLLHRYGKTRRWLCVAITLMAAGGIGNLIDRIWRDGKVVDYLDLQLFEFAVFNFADCCVTVGVIVLCVGILFLEKEEPDAKPLKHAKGVALSRRVGRMPSVEEADIVPDAEQILDAPELFNTEVDMDTISKPGADTGDVG